MHSLIIYFANFENCSFFFINFVFQNRNFDFDWLNEGMSNDTDYETYGGEKAASEIETITIQNGLQRVGRQSNISAYITLHSYGQYWFYPYGHRTTYTTEELPENFERLVGARNQVFVCD